MSASNNASAIVHLKIGQLSRQLHDSLNALGFADGLKTVAGELPDAKSRLSYISRLTSEAAEKVLNRVDLAKADHQFMLAEARNLVQSLKKDPVAAVATGKVMNFLEDMENVTNRADQHLTEIMMAQDFHDLTGQVIARVVTLTASIENQLIQLLVHTAPTGAADIETIEAATAATASAVESAQKALDALSDDLGSGKRVLEGPVITEGAHTGKVVTNQSEVDDLLASLGF